MKPLIRFITAKVILGFILNGFALAGGTEKIRQYHILPVALESKTQGCKIYGYNHEMQAVLRFLIFADANIGNKQHNIHYALRHSRALFRRLYKKDNIAENFGLPACFPSSWLNVGIALALMNPAIDPVEDAPYIQSLKPLQNSISIDPTAYPVMLRTDYNSLTGCKTSPEAYNRYRIAYEWVIIHVYYEDSAHENMRAFPEALYSAQPGEDGFVNQKCLVPAISRIASTFQLLDAQGRYKPTQ